MAEVLVVDDSRVMRDMITASLRPLPDVAITHAASGLEAIEQLSLRPFDLPVDATEDDDERVREAAVSGLSMIDHPRATATLRRTLRTGGPRIRAASARSLGQTSGSADADDARREIADALDGALDDTDAWVRYYACQSLGKLREIGGAERITTLLRDSAGQVRIAAVEALARLIAAGAPAGTSDALVQASRSTDGDLRRAALVGLGIARRPEGLAILKDASLAPDAATRLVAISAVAEFDGADAIDVLRWAASDTDDSVRSAAIGFLSTRTGPVATRALVDLLAQPSVRERTLAALAVAPDERVEGVLDALASASAELAPIYVTALTRMRRASAQAAMAAVLQFENVHARRAAAAGLASLATPESREALGRALADTDTEVRRISVAAIGNAPTPIAETARR